MGNFFSRYFKGDRVIWLIVVLLSLFSLLAVYSSTGSLAYRFQGGNTAYYFIRQLSFLIAGLAIVFLTHLVHYRVYSPLSPIFLYFAIPLLIVTLFFGTSINQAAIGSSRLPRTSQNFLSCFSTFAPCSGCSYLEQ